MGVPDQPPLYDESESQAQNEIYPHLPNHAAPPSHNQATNQTQQSQNNATQNQSLHAYQQSINQPPLQNPYQGVPHNTTQAPYMQPAGNYQQGGPVITVQTGGCPRGKASGLYQSQTILSASGYSSIRQTSRLDHN